MPRTVPAPVKPQKSPATQTAASSAQKAAGQVAPKVSKAPLKVTPQSKAVAPNKAVAKDIKPPKQKLVRDSFTFPQSEYLVLVGMKKRLLAAGVDAKKGELVRAGISMLAGLDDKTLVRALAAVEKLKAGRPAK